MNTICKLPSEGIYDEFKYERPQRTGIASLEVLPELEGIPWGAMAKNFIHSLRPEVIRVVSDGTRLDVCPWRVTVWVNQDMIIQKITQEVEVGLEGNYLHGGDLCSQLQKAKEFT